MWTRSLLKSNAKQALAGRYWRCFAVCLITGLLGVDGAVVRFTSHYNRMSDRVNTQLNGEVWMGNNTYTIWDELARVSPMVWGVAGAVALVVAVATLCWTAFVTGPLVVGRCRYFMESRQSTTPYATVLSIFRTPYLNVVKVHFLVGLKVALGCLLVIPGIYWSYCYWAVPYLLAENPYLTTGRAMELSRQMMLGEKWNTFVLELSFFGWWFLGSITFGIGWFFLDPYCQATYAELYAALRSKALATGLTDSSELGGFVRHEE